ncbi:aminoacyl-tRNA hydrolase [candidate division WOR-3 bacterium]|nr:aminoacyl-tRNA hydrolase [candidate division WOR-3 bacterium]
MIIFGLGNPGLKYRSTRHNVGYIFLDRLAKQYKKRFYTKQGYKIAKIGISKNKIYLIKPQCWMNQSGFAVSMILQERHEDFMVVVDDVNLPLGKIRLKSRGSDGGHLGLRSIIDARGNSNFPRLRIGIGCPINDVADYVLSPFKQREKKILMSVIEKGIKGIEVLVKDNFTKAQNYINAIDLMVKSEARNPKP